MNVYVDSRKHKNNSFKTKAERDKEVKELRLRGWTVKVGKYGDIDGSGEIWWYEATK